MSTHNSKLHPRTARKAIFGVLALLVLLASLLLLIVLNDMTYGNSTAVITTPDTLTYDTLSAEKINSNVILGETPHFTVYANNQNSETFDELNIFIKEASQYISIKGSFPVENLNITQVSENNDYNYILLSSGTYTLRQGRIISLKRKTVTEPFCMSILNFFWNDKFIYQNCDRFENRPWGAGEAPSLVALDAITQKSKVLMQSDLTHHFSINDSSNAAYSNEFVYQEIFVDKEADWNDSQLIQTKLHTFDLTSL